MTRFIIQILAMLLMTIDHIGMLLVPYGTLYEILRGIGRLALPLFAFLLGEGFRHTKNIKLYLFRLFLFGFIIELGAFIAQFVVGPTGHTELNIYLTLFMGLLISYLFKSKKWYIKLIGLIPLFIVYYTENIIDHVYIFDGYLGLTFEYGIYGIFIILCFTLFSKPLYQSISLILVNILLVRNGIFDYFKIYLFSIADISEALTILIIPILFLYNGKNGLKIPKWITYTYYPAHLAFLFLIS